MILITSLNGHYVNIPFPTGRPENGLPFQYQKLHFGGDSMNPSEEIKRLNKKLKKIKGDDPISRARKAALLRAIFELQQGTIE